MSPRDFQVFIYESEYRKIQAWVDKYQHLETGGDLFGLWADHRTAVVQLVLGPGKHCRRTSVSFYQDVDYLDRVGNRLTKEEGLCHIGEWHSHHRLGLSKPSGGDENTVWTNMDRYDIHRFFLFIANIKGHFLQVPDVTVGCFLFESDPNTGRRKPVLKGRFEYIKDESQGNPFRAKVARCLSIGAEICKENLNEKSSPKEKSNETPEESRKAGKDTGPSTLQHGTKDSDRDMTKEKEPPLLPSVSQQQNNKQNGPSCSGLDRSSATQDNDYLPPTGTDGDTNDSEKHQKKKKKFKSKLRNNKKTESNSIKNQDMKKRCEYPSEVHENRLQSKNETRNPHTQKDVVLQQESDDENGKQKGFYRFLCGVGKKGKDKKKTKTKRRRKK